MKKQNLSMSSDTILRFATIILLFITPLAYGYNLRPMISRDYLSNNSITSLQQDERGMLWIGTCDGLNIYNGRTISVMPSIGMGKNLAGTLIDKITETEGGTFWVQTYYGLDKLDVKHNTLENYSTINNIIYSDVDQNHIFFLIQSDKSVYYYTNGVTDFVRIEVPDISYSNVVQLVVDKYNQLLVFTRTGEILCYSINNAAGKITLKKEKTYNFPNRIKSCFKDNTEIYFIDVDDNLYEFDSKKGNTLFVADISTLARENGKVSSIVRFHDDFFIGFSTSGLIMLKKNAMGYAPERIPLNSGIFCLLKDRNQDIVWIGTDGQGVYSFSNDTYSIRSTLLSDFTFNIRRPVRALLLDDENSLWIGSKGDGIVRIKDYDINKNPLDCTIEYINTSNSQLSDNAVYAFSRSKKPLLWVGNEKGLNYFSYTDKAMKKISLYDKNGVPIQYIHDIYEQDSVLWIATVGMGVVKAKITWNGNNPSLKLQKHILINNGNISSNYFFSIYKEDSRYIWLANRGSGAFRIDTQTDEYSNIQFGSNTLNEVNVITKINADCFLMGTSFGLINYKSQDDYEVLNKTNGFPNNTIHGILQEDDGSYWLSTNSGVVNYDVERKLFRSYSYQDGLTVVEFSDGASYRDNRSGIIFFGGTNGFVSIQENNMKAGDFMPPIFFDDLSIFGKEQNIYSFLSSKGNEDVLTLNFSQNFFSLSFTAIDYLNGNNYNYQYKLDGLSQQWIDNGKSNTISLTNFKPGDYTLLVKYYNRVLNKESDVYSIKIRILPPWYQSTWAYILYFIILLLCVGAVIRYFVIKNKRKRMRALRIMEQQHKEDIYESKLRFFTNIAHEFCTPLTLIYGPCSRILSIKNIDKSVTKYTQIIQQNAERLNGLIQDLIDFRRIETGYKKAQIEELNISDVLKKVSESFTVLSESQNISFEKYIPDNIIWNSDRNFIVTIVTNLISNAFKYTSQNGKVDVRMEEVDDLLRVIITNTGKGIKEEDISKIFDRYSVLDNFENQDRSDLWSRNGLGLAISYSMVNMLNGEMRINSIPNEKTDFIVELPVIECVDGGSTQSTALPEVKDLVTENMNMLSTPLPQYTFDEGKPSILIIDDEPEILWLIGDIFASEFNILTINKASDAVSVMEETEPNIILCDVMMPGLSGIDFVREIKSNEKTAHIPLVLISAKHEVEEQIEGINAGAELYITKPFNVDYLKTSVKHLISRKEALKDYFSSPLSAFEVDNGKLTHKANKKLLKDILYIINKNIRNKDLSVNFIATKMNMSNRNLYRKVGEISDISIADMIRDCRLHVAVDLLVKSKSTIDEIIFKSGFTNRVSFFKAFSKKYGCTPKEYREQNSLE